MTWRWWPLASDNLTKHYGMYGPSRVPWCHGKYRSSNGDFNDVFFIVCHTCSCISLLKGRTCSLTPISMKLDLYSAFSVQSQCSNLGNRDFYGLRGFVYIQNWRFQRHMYKSSSFYVADIIIYLYIDANVVLNCSRKCAGTPQVFNDGHFFMLNPCWMTIFHVWYQITSHNSLFFSVA